jgi:hypothetical protein
MSERARSAWRGGESRNRLGERRIMIVFALLFLLIAGAAVLVAVLSKPPAPKAVCPKKQECPNPPRKAPAPTFNLSSAPRLVLNNVFVSPGLGYRLEYTNDLTTTNESDTNVTLVPSGGGTAFAMTIEGAQASDSTPQQLLNQLVSDLHNQIPDLQPDADPSKEILSPALAGHAGIGGFYQGTFDSPTGPVAPADVAVLAASDGKQTLAVAVMSANRTHTNDLFGYADQALLDTLRFRGDVVQ